MQKHDDQVVVWEKKGRIVCVKRIDGGWTVGWSSSRDEPLSLEETKEYLRAIGDAANRATQLSELSN